MKQLIRYMAEATLTRRPQKTKSVGELFIVDNAGEWTVRRYLYEWCEIARAFDIATGYFEIGALLSLAENWQKLEKIRLLMGDEVSLRTRAAFEKGLEQITKRLDQSLENEKEENDFLLGVPAIVEAIRSGKIETRVYRKAKFHAKAYITHPRLDVIGSMALVGSSNFTYAGLNNNIELNLRIRQEVEELQDWFEQYWHEAEEVTPEILRVIERHTRAYSPFDIYARSLYEYFQAHELEVSEWEQEQSNIYPRLDNYQREGYHSLMKIAQRYRGTLLCDGVGLGKSFMGLMVIERLLYERNRVALLVPYATRVDVWENLINRYLPGALNHHFNNLVIYNHTDLTRGGDFPKRFDEIAKMVDAIVIDEAHHFRNIASNRSRRLFEISDNKQLFLLTATPINNSLYDLMHLIEYFSRREPAYFSGQLGIHTLRGHFRMMEKAVDALVSSNGSANGKVAEFQAVAEIDSATAEEILAQDTLFRALVVQRSRSYVRSSLMQQNSRSVSFPERLPPQVVDYSLTRTYGPLLDLFERTFHQREPLLTLGIYNPLGYVKTEEALAKVDAFEAGRLSQVVALIRTMLLKRFESSAVAFEATCQTLLFKLLYFVRLHNPKAAKQWEGDHASLLARIQQQEKASWRAALLQDHKAEAESSAEEGLDEDVIPEEFKRKIGKLDHRQFDVSAMVMDALRDLNELAAFLDALATIRPNQDDKLQALIALLQTDLILSRQKVLIFTEFVDTARYLQEQLTAAGIGPLEEVDSQTERSRGEIIHAFAPYYNHRTSADLRKEGIPEIRILIATDVLAEGLNLQDATCIINYDLHWNPVRLMQRIGRVDRRLNPEIEAKLVKDQPHAAVVRGQVRIWNFLPPDELNRVLTLYQRVTHKTLRISRTFGIEGRKLLTPEDEYEALRDFTHAYEGSTTKLEEMQLAWQQIQQEHPELVAQLPHMPQRIFSGMAHPQPESRAIFFCYRLPAKEKTTGEWRSDLGFTRWLLYDLTSGQIEEDATRIFRLIQCAPKTLRTVSGNEVTLKEIRRVVDKHLQNSYLKRIQAPIGVKPTLVAWMELT